MRVDVFADSLLNLDLERDWHMFSLLRVLHLQRSGRVPRLLPTFWHRIHLSAQLFYPSYPNQPVQLCGLDPKY